MRLTRAPRWVRVLAPVLSFTGSICLLLALDVGPLQPLEVGGLRIEPDVRIMDQPVAVIRSDRPGLLRTGLVCLGLSALFWLWDAGTSK